MKKTLLVLTLVLVACSSHPAPKPTPPIALGVVPCADYCVHIRDELHCPQGEPTKKGAKCEEVCGGIEKSGFTSNTRGCSMKAKSCAEVDRCEN